MGAGPGSGGRVLANGVGKRPEPPEGLGWWWEGGTPRHEAGSRREATGAAGRSRRRTWGRLRRRHRCRAGIPLSSAQAAPNLPAPQPRPQRLCPGDSGEPPTSIRDGAGGIVGRVRAPHRLLQKGRGLEEREGHPAGPGRAAAGPGRPQGREGWRSGGGRGGPVRRAGPGPAAYLRG